MKLEYESLSLKKQVTTPWSHHLCLCYFLYPYRFSRILLFSLMFYVPYPHSSRLLQKANNVFLNLSHNSRIYSFKKWNNFIDHFSLFCFLFSSIVVCIGWLSYSRSHLCVSWSTRKPMLNMTEIAHVLSFFKGSEKVPLLLLVCISSFDNRTKCNCKKAYYYW